MQRRLRFRRGIAIGEAVGALLAVALVAGLGLGLGLFSVSFQTVFGAAMIGVIIGAIPGWVFSRPRATVEEVIGVPASRRIRILMWVASVGAIALALRAGIDGELLVATGFLALAGAWILHASRMAERARVLLHLSGCVFLLGLLLVSTAFLFGEF
ncbi:MAG: hypothetical protein LC674_06935 [Actinobacteria bacterium]|nr:hypothetical protein [Actinomycetota bacterium]